MAALDASIARGDLETSGQDLAHLLGRPATPLTEVISAAHNAVLRDRGRRLGELSQRPVATAVQQVYLPLHVVVGRRPAESHHHCPRGEYDLHRDVPKGPTRGGTATSHGATTAPTARELTRPGHRVVSSLLLANGSAPVPALPRRAVAGLAADLVPVRTISGRPPTSGLLDP